VTAHDKRRARTRRRFAAVGTILHALAAAAAAAAEGLSPEQVSERLKNTPQPPGTLTPAELKAELELARLGQRRKAGRRDKPANTNDELIALLRGQFPDLLVMPVSQARVAEIQSWLRKQPKVRRRDDDALARAIRRARQRARRPQ
jgi:hypothetical protein